MPKPIPPTQSPACRRNHRRSSVSAFDLALQPLEMRLMMARVQGIDVSHWQGNMNWTTAYNAGNRFTWAKATESTTYFDDQYTNNFTNAKAAGVLFGAYHFARPSSTADSNADGLYDDAVSEANYFWNNAHNAMVTGYLRPMLDMEDSGGLTVAQLSKWTNDFCTRMQQLTGVDPIIYCNTNYATSFLNSTVNIHDLWIANYTSTTYGDPNTNGSPPCGVWGSGNWDFWQYSAGGNGRGAANGAQSTDLDIDVFKGGTANGTDPTNDLQLLKQNFIIGAPKIPTGPSPANNASNISPLNVLLNWSDSVGATRYDVYLDNMNTPIATNVAVSQYNAGNIAGGAHTWKVVAKQASNDDDTFVSSPTWSFTASSLPLPGTPSNPNPNNVFVTSRPIVLDWADTPNASTYDVYLGTSGTPTYTNLTASQTPQINPLDGVRLWRVVAKNATGNTDGPQWQYTMDSVAPVATYGAQTPTNGAATLDFTVTYSDATSGVNFTSLDSSDVYVTAPDSTNYAATLISLDANANGSPRIATYRIAAPGGTWDPSDNGTYTVKLNASQVKDVAGNFSAAGNISTFNVNLDQPFAYKVGSVLHVDFDGTATPIALADNAGTVEATRSGQTLNFSGVTSIMATGTAANDALDIDGAIPVPLTFDNGSGNDTVTVTTGTYTFASDLAASPSQRNIDLTIAAGATAVLESSQHLKTLIVNGTASMTANGDHVLVVNDLQLPGASSRLDLGDNDLVIDYDSASPIAGVAGLIASGYDFGAWDGAHGIVTTQSSAAGGLTTLGLGESSSILGLGEGDTGTFGSETVDATALLIKYTYAGDANLDGTIDGGDYGIIDNFAQVPGADGYFNGDFNYDGVVDGGDYGIIDNNIQAQGAPL